MAKCSIDTGAYVKKLDSLHPTTRYAVEVVAGLRGPVCKWERLACERHLKDLQRQGTDKFPYVFDESRANRIFDWFSRCCRHPRGVFSGQPIMLKPFQKFDQGCIFGWVHKDTGRRRFKKAFEMRARGNAKSVEMSGKANYFMCSDCVYPPGHPEQRVYELTPEVDCVAVDRQQARRVWDDAVTMGKASPDILKRLKFLNNTVKHRTRNGEMRPFSKDTHNKDSAAPCLWEIDEYHAHPTSYFYDVGQSSMGKRAQCLLDVITTAGNNAENSPCKKEYDIGCKILTGEIIQDDYYVMIRQLDKGDNPHDFKNLPKANPMLQDPDDYSEILRQEIVSEHDLAYGSGDQAKIREWLIKRCDLWQEGSSDKYFDGLMDKWHEAEVSSEEFAELTKGLPCLNGDDLSKRTDLTGQAFLFKLPDDRYALKAHGFIPEAGVVRHEHSDRVPYRYFAKQGWCTITEGGVIDYDYLVEHARDEEFTNGYRIIEWDLDPALATQVENVLQKQEYTVVEVSQNIMKLSEPTKLFREWTMQGKLIHEKNELLDWCVNNAYQYTDANENIRISKKNKDDSQRVDLLAASINCMARLCAFDEVVGDISEQVLSDDFGF